MRNNSGEPGVYLAPSERTPFKLSGLLIAVGKVYVIHVWLLPARPNGG